MRGVVVVEIHAERREVAHELLADPGREFLGRHAQLARLDHDRRAVGVAGADVGAVVAAQFLETHPDIGLDVFHEMPHVNRAVGVRQGARDEDFSGRIGHGARLCHASGLIPSRFGPIHCAKLGGLRRRFFSSWLPSVRFTSSKNIAGSPPQVGAGELRAADVR